MDVCAVRGIANACSWDGATEGPHQPIVAVHAVGEALDDGVTPDGEEFCSSGVPLLMVLQPVQEQSAGHTLVVATRHNLGFLPTIAARPQRKSPVFQSVDMEVYMKRSLAIAVGTVALLAGWAAR